MAEPAPAPEPSPDALGAAAELTAVCRAFPTWHIWRSDEGHWWATRTCPLRPSRWPEDYALTVTAASLAALRDQLSLQQP